AAMLAPFLTSLLVCLAPTSLAVLPLIVVFSAPERNAANEPVSKGLRRIGPDSWRARPPQIAARLRAGGRPVRAAACAVTDRAQRRTGDYRRWRIWDDAGRVCAWIDRRLSEIRQRQR